MAKSSTPKELINLRDKIASMPPPRTERSAAADILLAGLHACVSVGWCKLPRMGWAVLGFFRFFSGLMSMTLCSLMSPRLTGREGRSAASSMASSSSSMECADGRSVA